MEKIEIKEDGILICKISEHHFDKSKVRLEIGRTIMDMNQHQLAKIISGADSLP